MKIIPLTPVFAARIEDVDLTRPLSDDAFAEIRAAFDEHSVIVFSASRSTTRARPPSAAASARWR